MAVGPYRFCRLNCKKGKKLMLKRIVPAVAVCAALIASCAASWGRQMPLVCANYAGTPPAMDGKMGPAWAGAADYYNNFVLFDGSKPAAPTTLKLLYDEKNFYVLYRCFEPKMKDLKTQVRPRNGTVWKDDSIDFFLIPIPGSTKPLGYHFIINASGSTYSETIEYPRVVDPSWSAPWKSAVSADADSWSVTVEIPWSSLGLSGPPKEGILEGNFGRARQPVVENSSLYPAGGFQNINNKVVIKLAKTSPGIQGLAWAEDEKDGTLTAKFNLLNPSKSDWAELEARNAGVRLAAKRVNMLSRKLVPVEISIPAPGDPSDRVVQLILKSTNGKNIYFASVPFMAKGVKKDLVLDVEQLYYYPGEDPVIKIESKVAGKLELLITKKNSKGAVLRKSAYVKPGTADIKLSGGGLKDEGDYIVTGMLTGSGAAKKETCEFGIVVPAKWPKVDVKKVTLGKEGTILVNGSPYFPITMYHVNVEDYQDMSYLGFNSVESGWHNLEVIKKELDAARNAGLLCNLGLPDRGCAERLGKRENVTAKVKGVKDHPALLFYHLVDEPAVSYYPTLEKGYNYVKELDPDHLQHCSMFNFLGHPDFTIDAAGRTRDIFAPDYYPFDCYPVTAVSEAVRVCVNSAKRAGWSKSIIYIGPCFEWLPTYRMPKPDELRLVTYLAVINGTKGLAWYSYREDGFEKAGIGYGLHVPQAAKIKSCFKLLNSEMCRLYPAICAPTPAQHFQAKPAGGLEFILKEDDNAWYLIAANTDAKSKDVTFSQQNRLAIPDGQVEVFSEYRSLKMTGGAFTDSFGPYAVHVYVIQKKGVKK
ncbi:MAG TPA: hypothetical protein DCL60_00235 [Armatimonadetes bacterium]|nr:hypothetical protein [Armatimonadota bacterium]